MRKIVISCNYRSYMPSPGQNPESPSYSRLATPTDPTDRMNQSPPVNHAPPQQPYGPYPPGMGGNYVEILAAYLQQQEQIRMLNHQIQSHQMQTLPLQHLQQLNSFDPIFNQLCKFEIEND